METPDTKFKVSGYISGVSGPPDSDNFKSVLSCRLAYSPPRHLEVLSQGEQAAGRAAAVARKRERDGGGSEREEEGKKKKKTNMWAPPVVVGIENRM